MGEYAPLFTTRIPKADQQCLQHAAGRPQPKPPAAGTWARDVLREAAVSHIAVQTMRRIDAVGDGSGLDVVIRTLNGLSAAHSPHGNKEEESLEAPTLYDLVGQAGGLSDKKNGGR